MEQFKGQSIIDFMKVFPDDASRKRYLADLKWHDGFECSKCGHNSGHRRSGGHGYFCYKCQHVENLPTGTLFHRVKFGCQKASVTTYKWNDYAPLKQAYDIAQVPRNGGKNFKELLLITHHIKSWIKTIPTHASKHHMDKYLNEFSFRLNRSWSKQSIFHRTIERMLYYKPYYHSQIIENLSV